MINMVKVQMDSIQVSKNSIHEIVRRLLLSNIALELIFSHETFAQIEIKSELGTQTALLGDFVCFLEKDALVLKESQHRLSMAMRGEYIDA